MKLLKLSSLLLATSLSSPLIASNQYNDEEKSIFGHCPSRVQDAEILMLWNLPIHEQLQFAATCTEAYKLVTGFEVSDNNQVITNQLPCMSKLWQFTFLHEDNKFSMMPCYARHGIGGLDLSLHNTPSSIVNICSWLPQYPKTALHPKNWTDK